MESGLLSSSHQPGGDGHLLRQLWSPGNAVIGCMLLILMFMMGLDNIKHIGTQLMCFFICDIVHSVMVMVRLEIHKEL